MTSAPHALFRPSEISQSFRANPRLSCHNCARRHRELTGICSRNPVTNLNCKILFVFYEPDDNAFKYGKWDFMFEQLCVAEAKQALKQDCISITGSRQCPNKMGRLTINSDACDSHAQCRGWLDKEIRKFNPSVIVPIGYKAAGSVMHNAFPQSVDVAASGGNYIGYQIPSGKYNAWICPVFSSRDEEDIELLLKDRDGQFRKNRYGNVIKSSGQKAAFLYIKQHMESALRLVDKRPFPRSDFDPTPKLSDLTVNKDIVIESVSSASKLADLFDKWSPAAKYAAFDYECNSLNPESAGAKVLTASVAFGDEKNILKTVVFSFTDKSYDDVWRRFLQSDIRKVGANIKFEERWSSVYFNQPVNNWYWDVLVSGHIQNATPGHANLKHLSLVHFGIGGYDKDVDAAIESKHLYGLNNLKNIKRDVLHLYNAIDSIMTLRLMYKQLAELEIKESWDRNLIWTLYKAPVKEIESTNSHDSSYTDW